MPPVTSTNYLGIY